MTKTILIFCITFVLIKSSFGQINIDSLKNELKNYRIENEINESGIRSVTYINNTLKYVINYDKTKEITENLWGNGIIAYQYDSLNRQISIITYDKNGDLHSADSPPIVKTKYLDNIEQIEYYYKKDKLASRIDVYTDSKGREIQFIVYDSNLKMESKHSTEYIDSINVKLKRYYDSTNVLTKNECGVELLHLSGH